MRLGGKRGRQKTWRIYRGHPGAAVKSSGMKKMHHEGEAWGEKDATHRQLKTTEGDNGNKEDQSKNDNSGGES